MLLLAGVAVVAIWRAQGMQHRHGALEHTSAAVASLSRAHARYFEGQAAVSALVWSQDPALAVIYRQYEAEVQQDLSVARAETLAAGYVDGAAALDELNERIGRFNAELESGITAVLEATPEEAQRMGVARLSEAMPEGSAISAELDQLVKEEQDALAGERTEADRAADITLALLIAITTIAFVVGFGALAMLVVSVARPLASLRASVRAIASGDLEARANVSGPQEVASLARDFNEMVDERRRAEEALRESESKYRSIFENVQDIYYRTDEKGIITEISPSVERWGYTRYQLIGTQVLDVYADPEERSALLKAIQERGELLDYEVHLKTGDGHVNETSVSTHVIRGPDGTFAGVEGTLRDIAERKRAEEALRASEERLRTLVTNAPVILFAIDAEGVFTLSEGKGLDAIGLRPEEVVGRSVLDVFPSVPDIAENIQRALAGETFGVTLEVAGVTFETRFTPIRDRDGRVVGGIGVATDISERKQAETALRESEAKYHNLFDTSRDAIFIADASTGEIVDANEAACSLMSLPKRRVVGMHQSVLHPPEEAERYRSIFAEHVASGTAITTDIYVQRPNGERIPVDISASTSVLGGRLLIQGVFRDISERKRAEQALRESEAKYRTIFENVQDIYYRTDEKGIITEISPAAERYGYTREGLIGTQVLDIYADPEQRSELLKVVLERGEVVDYEVRLKTADGRVIDTSVSTHVIRGPDGAFAGVEGALRDIAERKQAEQALARQTALVQAMNRVFEDALTCESEEAVARTCLAAAEQLTGSKFGFIGEVNQAGRFDTLALSNPGWQACTMPRSDAVKAIRDMEIRGIWGRIIEDGRPLTANDPSSHPDRVGTPDGHPPIIAFLGVPLKHGSETIGLIGVANKESGYDSADQEDLESLGVTFVEALMRRRAEEALREQVRHDPLTSVLNHAAIMEELRDLISQSGTDASHAVAMVDADGLKALNDTYGHQVGDAVLVAVAQALSRDGAIVGRYGGDEFLTILPGADRDAAERYRDAVLGAVEDTSLTDPETGASVPVAVGFGLVTYPTEAERIEDLIKLADSAMYATKRQRPVDATGRASRRPLRDERAARMVGELVPLLTSPGNLNDKLQLVAHRLSIGAGYDGVDFTLFDSWREAPTAQNTFAEAPEGLIDAWNRKQREDGNAPLRAILERTRRPVVLDDPQHDERVPDMERELLRAAGLRSAMIAPMIWRNELIGHVSVASKREAAFGPRDAQFLMTIATQVTAVVRMATLVEELQAASDRLAEARTETVMLLAASAEAHDHTTGLHLQNVRAITEALARQLGYGEEDARELGLAAVLHDIGKVRVPDSVLGSTGRLSDEEWELMKHHSTWGEQFLRKRRGFELAATIARSHHEHWDGSGYPEGLSSEAIPEAATIVAVADAFDAMISDRPYRAARSVTAALREITACSGTQFSPKVVQAMATLRRRKMLPLTLADAPDGKAAA